MEIPRTCYVPKAKYFAQRNQGAQQKLTPSPVPSFPPSSKLSKFLQKQVLCERSAQEAQAYYRLRSFQRRKGKVRPQNERPKVETEIVAISGAIATAQHELDLILLGSEHLSCSTSKIHLWKQQQEDL